MKLLSRAVFAFCLVGCFFCSFNIASAQIRLLPFGRSTSNNKQDQQNTQPAQPAQRNPAAQRNPSRSAPVPESSSQRYAYQQQQSAQPPQQSPQQPPQPRRFFARPALKEAPPAFSVTAYNGRVPKLQEASTSGATRREAISSIPWNELSPQTRQRVQTILADKTLYRRLSQQMTYCEPVMYDFLVEHPDVVVAMWEKLGVTQISLTENGRRSFILKESVGTDGVVDVLYKTKDYCIVYSRGAYHGPILPKPIDGEAILLLRSYYGKDEYGESYVVANVDAFVKIHNFGFDVFAKMFAPMLGKIADNNFEQTIAFVGNVSEAAQTNPEVIKRLALKLEPIRPEVRNELIRTAYQTAQLAIDHADEENAANPYVRNLAQQQAKQYESQKQQFEQERAQYMRDLHLKQQVLKANQKAQYASNQERADAMPESTRVHVGSIPYSPPENKYATQVLSPNQDLTGFFSELVEDDGSTKENESNSKPASSLGLDLNFNFNNTKESVPETPSPQETQETPEEQTEALPLHFEFGLSEPEPNTSEPNTSGPQKGENAEDTTLAPVGKFALKIKDEKDSAPLTVPTHAPAGQEKKLPIFAPVPIKSGNPAIEQPSHNESQKADDGEIVPVVSKKQLSNVKPQTVPKSKAVFQTPSLGGGNP